MNIDRIIESAEDCLIESLDWFDVNRTEGKHPISVDYTYEGLNMLLTFCYELDRNNLQYGTWHTPPLVISDIDIKVEGLALPILVDESNVNKRILDFLISEYNNEEDCGN